MAAIPESLRNEGFRSFNHRLLKRFTAEEIRHGVHGGAIETSIMLAAWPDQVRTDQVANFTPSSVAITVDISTRLA